MFEKYSPRDLRDAIEIEMQKTNDSKVAAKIAIARLGKNPLYYQNMMKAKPTKYVKRIPKAGGGYTYIYDEKKEKKTGWLDKFANFFGIKDRELAVQKINIDYDNNQIKEKYNVSLDSWKNHIGEYFKNKEKWDKFFSGKKEKKKISKKNDKKDGKKDSKKDSKKERVSKGIKLSVMKEIFGIYGGKIEKTIEKEKTKEEIPETIKDDKETKEEKAEDKKVAKEINGATPENRNETERDIIGIPEPSSEEDIVISVIEFSPKETTVTIPFYTRDGPKDFSAKDYTDVIPKDIYLASEKKILSEDRPKYIPEIDEDFIKHSKYFVPTMKLSENKYIIQTHREIRRGTSQPVIGENKYAIVTREVMTSTQDYYLKLAKAKRKKEYDEHDEETGYKWKRKRISMISINNMNYSQSNFMKRFTGKAITDWDLYTEIRNDLKQKTEDMEIQLEEYYNTHAKGRETAYGEKGLKNNLLEDYGVKVKRQNGAEINDKEIGEIKLALDDVFFVFGNRSSMARNSNLKISHSGEKLMHARQAAGLYMPAIKAIGITAKYGQEGTGFILAHEWSHFMDHYLGGKKGRNYISDDPGGIAGDIASTFRKNMTKMQKSKYQNRTCECFSRAMEQYWAIKTDNKEILSSWDTGNHPTVENFKENVMPLIDQFFQENDKLLKAIFKIRNKFFKKVK